MGFYEDAVEAAVERNRKLAARHQPTARRQLAAWLAQVGMPVDAHDANQVQAVTHYNGYGDESRPTTVLSWELEG